MVDYTPNEMMTVAAARALKDDDVCFVGIGMHSFRRHATWYTKGFRIDSEIRAALMRVETVAGLQELLRDVDRSQPFPPSAMRVVRGKATGMQKVALPLGYLDNLDDDVPCDGSDDDPGDGG